MVEKSIPCQLCGGTSIYAFSKIVLAKYDVAYYKCKKCLSLQTETSYWLEEAYQDPRPVLDIGAVRRNQDFQYLIFFLTKSIGISAEDKILDWGGGNGLLVRMMRDIGLDAYLFEKYVKNHYAVGFEYDAAQHYAMITTFELWEHLSNPAKELQDIFTHEPRIVLLSTCIYEGQGDDWWYLVPETGRHIFFYSEKAIHYVAERFGYTAIIGSWSIVFLKRQPSYLKKLLLIAVLGKKTQWLLKILFPMIPKHSLIPYDFKKLATSCSRSSLYDDDQKNYKKTVKNIVSNKKDQAK